MFELITGGVLGLIGSITTAFTNYKMKKLEIEDKKNQREHEIQMVKAETEAMIQETKAKISIVQETYKGQERLEDAKAYTASQMKEEEPLFSEKYLTKLYTMDGWLRYPARFLAMLLTVCFGLVDIFRALMRPGITTYEAFILTWFAYRAWDIMQSVKAFTPELAAEIFMLIMKMCIFLAASAFTWWFADRSMAKFLTTLIHEKK